MNSYLFLLHTYFRVSILVYFNPKKYNIFLNFLVLTLQNVQKVPHIYASAVISGIPNLQKMEDLDRNLSNLTIKFHFLDRITNSVKIKSGTKKCPKYQHIVSVKVH